MRTRLELVLEVTHPEWYDPTNNFVHYFCDDEDGDHDPFEPDMDDVFVVVESWETVKS